MFSWSGSAAIGGLLVDHWGYRFNFVVTGLVHCCGKKSPWCEIIEIPL